MCRSDQAVSWSSNDLLLYVLVTCQISASSRKRLSFYRQHFVYSQISIILKTEIVCWIIFVALQIDLLHRHSKSILEKRNKRNTYETTTAMCMRLNLQANFVWNEFSEAVEKPCTSPLSLRSIFSWFGQKKHFMYATKKFDISSNSTTKRNAI